MNSESTPAPGAPHPIIVYTAETGSHEDNEIHAVYTHKEHAELHLELLSEIPGSYWWDQAVREWTIHADPPELEWAACVRLDDGEPWGKGYAFVSTEDRRRDISGSIKKDFSNISRERIEVVYGIGKTLEDALQSARDHWVRIQVERAGHERIHRSRA